MARIALGVTGSVAATRTPQLVSTLRDAGHETRVVATDPSLYFFDSQALSHLPEIDRDPASTSGTSRELGSIPQRSLFRDQDEWPGELYRRGDPVLHIELRKWADLLIVAPLDANSLAKFALGLSDNLLTCLFRAWDFRKPVILAPAMNTLMWESPVTLRHLRQILQDRSTQPIPNDWTLDEAPEIFARFAPSLILISPTSKRLACGDVGTGAMAEVSTIALVVQETIGSIL